MTHLSEDSDLIGKGAEGAKGALPRAEDRAVVNEAASVSALRASIPSAGLRQAFFIHDGAVSRGHSLTAHPADGTVAQVDCGGGAAMSICDPTADTSLEWMMRYGNPEAVRFTVASILSSYDYLIRSCHSTKEAQRRVALLRRAVARLWNEGPLPPRSAQAIEAGTAETAGLGPKDESAVAESDVPEQVQQ